MASFVTHLQSSKRIVAVLGAGLSASSGLPTFRGAGGYWRKYDATMLATPIAFKTEPSIVWQFYSYRRHMALNAKPNPAHFALAELSKRNPNFLTLSQNVDGLSPRAGHPEEQLKLLHGNLFDVKCWDEDGCGYIRHNDLTDPIVPALAIPEDQATAQALFDQAKKPARSSLPTGDPDDSSSDEDAPPSEPHPLVRGADISSTTVPLATLPDSALPQCPQCNNLLRPGVVWFGESLPRPVLASVDAYFDDKEPIDLCLVIGTSSKVYPAAGYAQMARAKGARVAVVNMDVSDARNLTSKDWFFEGDAAVLVPKLFESVIGEVRDVEEGAKAEL